MSFWAPYMERMKEEEDKNNKAQMEGKSKEEIEIEDLKRRQLIIADILEMVDAATIREYKDNDKRIKYLQEEIDYIKWFDTHKTEVYKFFQLMKDAFISDNKNIIYPRAVEDGNVEYQDCVLNKNFLKRLLKRYGYEVKEDTTYNNQSSGLIIKYRKEN